MNLPKNSPVIVLLLGGGLLVSFIGMIIMSVVVSKLINRFPYPDDCTNRDCIFEASTIKANMNVSADPCTNFYEYACGNFPKLNPLDGRNSYIDSSTVVSRNSEENLKHLLEEPVKEPPTSYQWKMKTFFQSCIDDYLRSNVGGGPLINDIKNLGGWYAFPGTFQLNDWRKKSVVNKAIEGIHTMYGANPFFTISVSADWDQRQPSKAPDTNSIKITPTTLDMGSSSVYLSTSGAYSYIKDAYKTFVETLITHLWQDGNLGGDLNGTLHTVWNDIIFVETTLANISHYSPVITDPSAEHITIQQLDSKFGSVIDWYHFFSTYFQGAVIQPSTEIHAQYLSYLEGVTMFIDQLYKTDNGTRQLNNYLMWKLTYFYRSELGWDYIHANRLWAMKKRRGHVNFVGMYNWCYIELDRHLPHGLSALFISSYFKHVAYDKVQAAYNYFKLGFVQRIDSMTWMDANTRNTAKNKVNSQKDFIGYDINFEDQTYMDTFFSSLVIQKDQHFANFRQIMQWKRQYSSTQIGKISPDQWPSKIYQTTAYHDTSTNVNYFPAGMLQHPIFDSRIPMYANFGGMGAYVADLFHQSVNYPGRFYDETGKTVDGKHGWWSDSTYDAYMNNILPCHGHVYDNATLCYSFFMIHVLAAYEDFGADSSTCHPLEHPMLMASRDIEESSCLETSYKAYHDYVNDNGPEKTMPGFQHENVDQAFLLSFSQMYCFNRVPIITWLYWNYYNLSPNNVLLNGIMSQSPAFKEAFQCSADDPMVYKQQCPGF